MKNEKPEFQKAGEFIKKFVNTGRLEEEFIRYCKGKTHDEIQLAKLYMSTQLSLPFIIGGLHAEIDE